MWKSHTLPIPLQILSPHCAMQHIVDICRYQDQMKILMVGTLFPMLIYMGSYVPMVDMHIYDAQ